MVNGRDDDLHPEVAAQLESVDLDPDRPLVISDADEVVFDFMTAFEAYLGEARLYFNWESFGLDGNVCRIEDRKPLGRDEMFAMLDSFFAARTAHLEPIEGAAEALAALAGRAQILIVSNLPIPRRHLRREALDRHAMTYPLIANTGPKGPLVRKLAADFSAPVFFIDDSPRHIGSVADCADGVHRIHFIGHPRLASLIGPATGCHHRIDDWPEARRVIEGILATHGY